MSKIVIFLFIGFLPQVSLFSQNIYYYRLTKKVQSETVVTDVSGGQFLTFIGDICYESDKKGIGVGHGTLQYNNQYSDGLFKVYMGKSYWGNDATFKFTGDLMILNVFTGNGDIYLYKRATPPENAITCSLIRKSASGNGGSSGGGTYPVLPTYPIVGANNPIGSNGSGSASSGGNTNQKPQRQRTWRVCSLCHGTGTIVRDSHVGTYGTYDPMVYCSECGRSWLQSTGHHHITCPTCRGQKGFWDE